VQFLALNVSALGRLSIVKKVHFVLLKST